MSVKPEGEAMRMELVEFISRQRSHLIDLELRHEILNKLMAMGSALRAAPQPVGSELADMLERLYAEDNISINQVAKEACAALRAQPVGNPLGSGTREAIARLIVDECPDFMRNQEPCPYCLPGTSTGLPGNACENCMNTRLKYPEGIHASVSSPGESQ